MKLYFNGDSFVAGAELADDLLPGYPGLTVHKKGMCIDESNPGFVWSRNSYSPENMKRRYELSEEITRIEYEKAFPNLVGKLLNIPVINNAFGGSSMDRIARTTISDLYHLKKSNPAEKIIALIGTTNYARAEHAEGLGWHCLSVTTNRHFPFEAGEYLRKYKVMYENDYHMMMNFYKNIILISDFCKVNDIKLLWIAARDNVTKNFNFDINLFKSFDYSAFRGYANLTYALDMIECLDKFEGRPSLCPGGHLGANVHEYIAGELAKLVSSIQ